MTLATPSPLGTERLSITFQASRPRLHSQSIKEWPQAALNGNELPSLVPKSMDAETLSRLSVSIVFDVAEGSMSH